MYLGVFGDFNSNCGARFVVEGTREVLRGKYAFWGSLEHQSDWRGRLEAGVREALNFKVTCTQVKFQAGTRNILTKISISCFLCLEDLMHPAQISHTMDRHWAMGIQPQFMSYMSQFALFHILKCQFILPTPSLGYLTKADEENT